jgi:hypothetical protein
VDQFFHAGADEGEPEQVAVVSVDDHAGAAGVAVGEEAGADDRGAGVDVDHPDAVSAAFGLVGVSPTAPAGGRRRTPAAPRGFRR